MLFTLICSALCLFIGGVASSQGPTAHVEHGAVRGTYMKSVGGRTYSAFRGIPYARPPVGKHRFKEPVATKPWPGVWDATRYGSLCLQYEFTFDPDDERVIGDEDCLFINIFTPKTDLTTTGPLLDVFVYIHGGGFSNGASSYYGANFLMDHDVVYVTFNYRLGILGFLSTEDEVVPGNNGLKDQAAALRWIQRNIAAFGGNPSRVTISGTSAGGASVHYHYLSPLSRGLFQRGMSFSGSALLCWAQAEALRNKAFKLGDLVGCNHQSSRDLVECLRHRPARLLVQQFEHFQTWRYNPFTPFGPTVETAGAEPFISKHPVEIITEGGAQDLPWLTSITSEEGLYPVADFATKEDVLKELDDKFPEIAPHLLFYNFTVPRSEHKNVANKIRKFYFKNKPISMQTVKELTQMAGDRIFVYDIERAARLMAKANTSPVYFYKFSYRGKDSQSNFMSRTDVNLGVSHADDTAYILDMKFSNTQQTQEDRDMTKLMVDMCINFAKNGNPTPSDRAITWKSVESDSEDIDFLHIASSSDVKMDSSVDLGNRRFWDSLPIAEPQITAFKIPHHSDEL
ncbi:venom carboxylesterase-6 [Anabrus simplex]|uniref:venom carboxylesterase-6 n=1 Tax=Anabrus simplex TaxID=316456 RepID=UPI0035A2F4A3